MGDLFDILQFLSITWFSKHNELFFQMTKIRGAICFDRIGEGVMSNLLVMLSSNVCKCVRSSVSNHMGT